MSECKHEWTKELFPGPEIRWCHRCNDTETEVELANLRAEIERLQEMVRQAVAERNEDLADLSTSRRANGRIIKERDAARAEVERLMITNNDCNRAIDWAKDEMNKLREVVRHIHAMTGRDVDWAAFPGVAATALREIHKLTKEKP